MTRLPSLKTFQEKRTPFFLLLALSLFCLSGCNNASPPPAANNPAPPANATPAPAQPAAGGTAAAPAAAPAGTPAQPNANDVSNINKAVNSASEIVTSGKNAFMSKLPKLKVEIDEPKGPEANPVANLPPPPPITESIQLAGIVFNPKKPMALISSSEGIGQQIVTNGQLINLNNREIKIVNITRDTVQVMEAGNPSSSRTLTLPSMVGYNAPGSSKTTGKGSNSDPNNDPVQQSSLPPAPDKLQVSGPTQPNPNLQLPSPKDLAAIQRDIKNGTINPQDFEEP